MRVRIHRGAHEVGGSCVELEASGERLVLDLGVPLATRRGDVPPLPAIPGLASPDPSLLGVLLTHVHADHCGLVALLHADVPIGVGERTQRIEAYVLAPRFQPLLGGKGRPTLAALNEALASANEPIRLGLGPVEDGGRFQRVPVPGGPGERPAAA